MKDSTKNTLTNIIGLILLGINTYMYYWGDETLISFLTILAVSLSLFLFKADQTKGWLKKVLSKIISK